MPPARALNERPYGFYGSFFYDASANSGLSGTPAPTNVKPDDIIVGGGILDAL